MAAPVSVVRPSRGWVALRLGDLWEYRELVYFLVWRDIKVRYKQTLLGVTWAVLQPFLTMVVFSLFFGRLARVPSDGVPYPLFAFAALVPWTLFAYGLTQGAASMVGSQHLITKVYFPRMAIPVAAVLSGLVDFAAAAAMLFVLMAWYHVAPAWPALTLPAFVLLALVAALGAALWLAALNVLYRDVRYVLPFLAQLWLFCTPIAYPSSLLAGSWRTAYALNPMVSVADGVRWALLGTPAPPASELLASTLVAIALLVSGAFFFRRMERTFADVV